MSDIKEKSDIAEWWAANPMTYGADHGTVGYVDGDVEFGTKEFFERADQEFYSWNTPLHDHRPFGKLFPYDDFVGKRVLEIGCGMGCMSMNWARNGAQLSAVDLNPVAIEQSNNRFNLFDLEGDIQQSDANDLPFDDATFDYAYSWGVLHHSPDLVLSMSQMMKTIKPGGRFGIMLYNRNSFLQRYQTEFIEGFLHYENRFLGPLELASRYGDAPRDEGNPHTWPVTEDEMRKMLAPYAKGMTCRRLGTELPSIFRYMLPGLGMILPAWVLKPWARRFGWSLWMEGTRI